MHIGGNQIDYGKIVFEDKCFIGTAPELDGCMTHGETQEECYKMIIDAISLYLKTLESLNELAPEPARGVVFA